MPIYYLLDNLDVRKQTRSRYSLQGLWELSEKSRQELIDSHKIRELRTLAVSSYEDFSEYAIMLEELGIETLGDFAGANPETLPEELLSVQQQALAYLHPGKPAAVPESGCC